MPSDLERLEKLFHEAIALPPDQRAAFLDHATPSDPALRAQLNAMLAEHEGGTRGILAAVPSGHIDIPDPTRIGDFQIIRLLGQGGMGRVYEASQDSPRRLVAIKVLADGLSSTEARRRFAREAQVLAELKHPGIAQVYQTGVLPDEYGRERVFIAMELVRGQPLGAHARDAGLSIAQRCELLARVCDAVQHAHQRGIIHRDLKPANILVEASDSDPIGQPKVLDFGIARLQRTTAEGRTEATESGRVLGTLAYMSPEQIENSALVDTRSDIYALGVIGYELLANTPPIDLSGLTLASAARTLRDVEPAPLGRLVRACRGDIETIFRKALEKDRDRRYAGVSDLAEDLRRAWRHEPIIARPPSAAYQLRKFAARNRVVVAAGLLAAAALLAATTVSSIALIQARRDRQLAREGQRAAEAGNQAAERESQNLRQTISFFSKGILFQSYGTNQGRAISVIDALRRADARISIELAQDPLTEARLRYSIGLVALADLDMARAETQLRRAAELISKLAPRYDDEDRMITLHLARAVRELGRYDEAEAINRRVLAEAQAAGDDWIRTNALGELALTIAAAGQTEEAERLLTESCVLVQEVVKDRIRNWIGPFMRTLRLLIQRGKQDQIEPALAEQIRAIDSCQTAAPDERRFAKTLLLSSLGEELLSAGSFLGVRYLDQAYAAWCEDDQDPIARARAAVDLGTPLVVFARLQTDPPAAQRLASLAADAKAQLDRASPTPDQSDLVDRLRASVTAMKAWSCILDARPDEALELLGPDRTTLDQILSPLPDPTRAARARALSIVGMHEQAAVLARREYEAALRQHGLASAQAGWALGDLTGVLDRAGRPDEADQVILELVRRLQDSPNQRTLDYALAQLNITHILRGLRRDTMAIDILENLVAILESTNAGPDGTATPLLQQVIRARALIRSDDETRDQRFILRWSEVLLNP